MDIEIRKAFIEDEREVLELCRFFYSRWSPYAYQYFKNRWHSIYEQIVLAIFKNKIVGYLTFRAPDSDKRFKDTFYISDLYVLPKYRRKGIGTKLVESAERIKKEKGLCRLVANVDRESSAIKFYRGLGFTLSKKLPKSLKLIKTEN